MTNTYYTLEEAAEKLKFSETVLVRLSQYLKVPQAAYEEAGYLSFKGDLAFSEQDLTFFTQVKERLLLGESLDDVKNRLPQRVVANVDVSTAQRPAGQFAAILPQASPGAAILEEFGQEPEVLGGVSNTLPGEMPPLRGIQDRTPYEKAAEKSFERYKSMHRSGVGKVFENMLKEVGGPQSSRKAGTVTPAFRPMRGQIEGLDGETTPPSSREDAILPFSRWVAAQGLNRGPALSQTSLVRPGGVSGMSQPVSSRPSSTGAVWESLIQQATQKPRGLNIQLKNAAILLREHTLGQSPP